MNERKVGDNAKRSNKNIHEDLVQDFEHVKWGILEIIAKHISSIDGWVLQESIPCLKDHVLGWQ